MLLIQILIVAFAVFAILRALHQFRQGRLTRQWLAFWLVFWLFAIIVVILPETSEFAARLTGVGRGVDLIIYLSIVLLFYLVFRLFIKIEEGERQLTRLVRKLALDDFAKTKDENPRVRVTKSVENQEKFNI
ncbi:DUF2304 family protein [Patescibacteria group bacterium]|nr:DUF2304 family protein [Patescibacteria group bacterium]MBU1705454.1 DUF2304 family protein [Patescibacteria group bacterium]